MTTFPRLAVVPPSTDRATYLVRRFYPQSKDDDTEHPRVAVATGFAPAGGLELAKLAGLAAGDARALIAQATANTSDGPRSWSVSEKSGLIFKSPSLLRAIGDAMVPVNAMATDGGGLDDLSSDLVLDEAFLASASQLLKSSDLIVTIPKRGWLMAAKCRPGEFPVMIKFSQVADGIAGRGGQHALTKNAYFVKDGKIIGVSGQGYLSLLTQHDAPWNI